jgi:hypothetical protein
MSGNPGDFGETQPLQWGYPEYPYQELSTKRTAPTDNKHLRALNKTSVLPFVPITKPSQYACENKHEFPFCVTNRM